MQLILMQGLPGSGRSAFAKTIADDHGATLIRFRGDINQARNEVQLALSKGWSVVLDSPLTRRNDLFDWLSLGAQYHAELIVYRVRCTLKYAIEQNKLSSHPLAESALTKMHNDLNSFYDNFRPHYVRDIDA